VLSEHALRTGLNSKQLCEAAAVPHLDPSVKGKPHGLVSVRGLKKRDWPDGMVPFSLQRLSFAMYSVLVLSVPFSLLSDPVRR
jgi:hypothetical protein